MLIILCIGMLCVAFGGTVIIWSTLKPQSRLWPIGQLSPIRLFFVWMPTFLGFGCAILLGLLDWNAMTLPSLLRWGIGLPLIIIGHIVVSEGVKSIGLPATSGAIARLKTHGIYRHSRNPQYIADISSLIGWGILSASFWALPVLLGIVLVFTLTPFAEEPWLRTIYGKEYEDYCAKTPRFF